MHKKIKNNIKHSLFLVICALIVGVCTIIMVDIFTLDKDPYVEEVPEIGFEDRIKDAMSLSDDYVLQWTFSSDDEVVLTINTDGEVYLRDTLIGQDDALKDIIVK